MTVTELVWLFELVFVLIAFKNKKIQIGIQDYNTIMGDNFESQMILIEYPTGKTMVNYGYKGTPFHFSGFF